MKSKNETNNPTKEPESLSRRSAIITAGAGVPVAKHGNYGVSSACGSSNVLESLGVKFSNDTGFLERAIATTGICVLHAPLFHPAMKNVAPIRRELGVKTFFNMLGPMVNPAFPKNQMVGVFNLELLRLYNYLYQDSDKNYSIVHALDGYDEISLTGNTKIISNHSESMLSPSDLNIKQIEQSDIFGGSSVKEAAKIFKKIISGKGTDAQNNVVCANAGLAIATVNNSSHQNGFQLAKESLESGRAKKSLEQLIELSK